MNKRKRMLLYSAGTVVSLALLLLFALGGLILYSYANIDFETDLALFERAKSFNATTFYASATPYGESFSDGYTPEKIETSGTLKKEFYSIDEISPYLIDGFIAVEDKEFYEHKGVNWRRTVAAALNCITRGQSRFGASTITQQVIKNISGDNEIRLTRKLSEIIRAMRIEKYFSKKEILEVYLNVVPMSENMYGVGVASRAYFGKEPGELTATEAATLIGITNATTAYNPYKNPDSCRKKRDTVLRVMYNDGVINEKEYETATGTELSVIPRESRQSRFNSWFVETVIAEATHDLTKKYNLSNQAAELLLLGGGYSVYTTVDTRIQSILEKYFENPENFSSEIKNGLNYAMSVVDVPSGRLVATVGRVGEKSGNRLLNHATALHTPGSVLKPLGLYAPLLDEGKVSWSTVFDDTPTDFYTEAAGYRLYPHNSPNVYDGLITVKDAIRLSKNTVAVRLCKMRTPEAVFKTLSETFGIDSLVKSRKNESGVTITDIAISPMALGQLTDGVSLNKLIECYNVFPSGGVLRECASYILITDSEGEAVIEKRHDEKRIFKTETAEIMNKLLETVAREGTAKVISLKNFVDTAVKTGTSGNSRDKLLVGYTPYYTAGIWCGYDRGGSSVDVSPSHIKIWDDVMLEIHRDIILGGSIERFSENNIVSRPYCMDSGEIYSDVCIFDPRGNRMEYGYFSKNHTPQNLCTRHVLVRYDTDGKGIATAECPEENIAMVSLIRVNERSFPTEVYITDAEYVQRDGDYTLGEDNGYPYFYAALPEGEYVGVSKRRRHFNAACSKHGE